MDLDEAAQPISSLREREIGDVIAVMRTMLNKLSSSSRATALRAVSATYGFAITFPGQVLAKKGAVPIGSNVPAKQGRQRRPAAKTLPASQTKVSELVRTYKNEIRELNSRISQKRKTQRVNLLPDSDELLQRREELFRGLKEAKLERVINAGQQGPEEQV